MFLHGAYSSALSSMHFLVSGYGLASGNAMRQCVEGIAMGLLMLTDAEYTKFDAQQGEYPAHKAPSKVLQKKVQVQLGGIVDITHKDWQPFLKMADFYSNHSHAGALALAFHIKLDWPSPAILGGEYDPAKTKEYRQEIRRAAEVMKSLTLLVEAISEHYQSA